MPSAFEHPSLQLPVTAQDRERALGYLQQAYAEQRLTEWELDQRIEMVLQARTRREMNRAFDGLARIPVGTGAVLMARRASGQPGPVARTGSALAHLSGLGTWVFGPAVFYAATPRHSHTHREAAKAFNFQLVMGVLAGLVGMLTSVLGAGELAMPVGALVWLVLTVVGGARAASGEDWTNPVSRVVPFKLLDEGRAPRQLGR